MPEPEPLSYPRRFFATLRREILQSAKRKLITGASVGVLVVVLRLALGKLKVIALTKDQTREIWINLLILLGAYALVLVGLSFVNLVRTPALLDKERAKEISDLARQLELVKSTPNLKDIKLKLAALIKQERELRESLKSASDGNEYTELIRNASEWVNEIIALLNEAELPTDAEGFYQVGFAVVSAEQLARFAHVAEWKREVIARLAMYRQKLDEIISNRRL